ncbi:hypothetical protein LTR94_028036, partial [Friedmanniomyces endolithicus]
GPAGLRPPVGGEADKDGVGGRPGSLGSSRVIVGEHDEPNALTSIGPGRRAEPRGKGLAGSMFKGQGVEGLKRADVRRGGIVGTGADQVRLDQGAAIDMRKEDGIAAPGGALLTARLIQPPDR